MALWPEKWPMEIGFLGEKASSVSGAQEHLKT